MRFLYFTWAITVSAFEERCNCVFWPGLGWQREAETNGVLKKIFSCPNAQIHAKIMFFHQNFVQNPNFSSTEIFFVLGIIQGVTNVVEEKIHKLFDDFSFL